MVTAETAVALPALVLVLALCVAGLALGVDQVRCADAVRMGARMAARAQSEDQVRAAVAARVPAGSVVTVGQHGDLVQVAVTGHARSGWVAAGLRVGCSASASAPVEGT